MRTKNYIFSGGSYESPELLDLEKVCLSNVVCASSDSEAGATTAEYEVSPEEYTW